MEMALSRSSDPEELKQMIANPAAVLRRQRVERRQGLSRPNVWYH